MEFLPEIVLTVLSVVLIPIIVQGIKLWREKLNPDIDSQKQAVTVIAFVLSIAAAFIWSGSALPEFSGDPVAYLQALLLVGSAFFTAVKGVYDFILDAFFEKLGWV